jgi:hypothetical protein
MIGKRRDRATCSRAPKPAHFSISLYFESLVVTALRIFLAQRVYSAGFRRRIDAKRVPPPLVREVPPGSRVGGRAWLPQFRKQILDNS